MAVMSLIVPILGYYPLKTRGAAGAFIMMLCGEKPLTGEWFPFMGALLLS
jgi:hypothetical protein